MSEELDDLIARFGRWLRNTGFDGGVNSPPVKAHDALLRLRAENERLKEALDDLVSWFPETKPVPVWKIRAGEFGADDAVEAARNALAQVAK